MVQNIVLSNSHAFLFILVCLGDHKLADKMREVLFVSDDNCCRSSSFYYAPRNPHLDPGKPQEIEQ